MEHDARAQQRHELSLERLEKKHERQVQFALDKERVELEGTFRNQTKEARQSAAKVKSVLEKQRVLREQLQRALNDRNGMVK
jgi:hypothetical protein